MMNSLQFQLLTESLDSDEIESEPDIDPCYDEILINSIILRYLNNPSRIINIFKDILQRKQNPIEKQLAVVLYRLGGKATIWDICSKFGIAEAVVDHQGIFINYDLGYPASVHDANVFRNSSLYRCKNQLFEETDYVLADSAYPISPNIIPSFKNPSGLDKNRQIEFNKKHSKSRVVIEQAFGRLKSRFQLLRELRTKSTKIGTDLIEISLILHNILEKSGD
ncbi:21867_t:CDS:2, partial [Gigaspora rosea]